MKQKEIETLAYLPTGEQLKRLKKKNEDINYEQAYSNLKKMINITRHAKLEFKLEQLVSFESALRKFEAAAYETEEDGAVSEA